jgi:sulfatase maturation enzyme AslB (radical SAM superfamily)
VHVWTCNNNNNNNNNMHMSHAHVRVDMQQQQQQQQRACTTCDWLVGCWSGLPTSFAAKTGSIWL